MTDTWITVLMPLVGENVKDDGDHGTGLDDANTDAFFVSVSGADAGTGVDAGSRLITDNDTGEGTDTGTITFTGADVGTSVEVGSIVITAVDTFSVVELGVLTGITYTGADTGTAEEEAYRLMLNTVLATGIASRKWHYDDVEHKWLSAIDNRWSARMVDSVDQIS